MNSDLIKALAESPIYKEYEKVFTRATGLPVSITPVESWQIAHNGKRSQNRFCQLMASQNCSCAACLSNQEELKKGAVNGAHTARCHIGMSDSAVPIRLGSELVGFLQTGQVFCKKPTAKQFQRVAKKLEGWGIPVDAQIEEAYFNTRVMTPTQYESMVGLLTIFSDHLAVVANQVAVQQKNAEMPMISRAKAYIRDNQAEDLSLGQVAQAVHTSTFYFCKMFKKSTGLNFTEYLSRVRIEKAKNLLLNANLRVSELAFAVGFQSLTHFNRVFRRIVGQSPTQYRKQLALG